MMQCNHDYEKIDHLIESLVVFFSYFNLNAERVKSVKCVLEKPPQFYRCEEQPS